MKVRAHTTILAHCKLTRAGYQRMFQIRRSLNWLYNQALQQRKTAWESDKKNVSYFDQCQRLTLLRREDPQGLGAIALGPQRGMLKRLDEAFQAFFSRLKAGQNPGYPRFKPLSRCVTIDVTQFGPRMVRKQGQRYVIRIRGFPPIECFPSRELPGGHRLKSLRLTLRGRRWEASLAYAVQQQALPSCTRGGRRGSGSPQAHDAVERCGARGAPARLAGDSAAAAQGLALQAGVQESAEGRGAARALLAPGVGSGAQCLPPGNHRHHPQAWAGRSGTAEGRQHDPLGQGNKGGAGQERCTESRSQPGDTEPELVSASQSTPVQGSMGWAGVCGG